jgi:hypothetical protein
MIGDRVQTLKYQLKLMQNILLNLVMKIEEIHSLDIDGNGRIVEIGSLSSVLLLSGKTVMA